MTNNFNAVNSAIPSPIAAGTTITMQASIAAATQADAGSWRYGFRLLGPTGATVNDYTSSLVPISTTPQNFTRNFTLPANSAPGTYSYTSNVKDGSYAWQNTTGNTVSFVVQASGPASLNLFGGNDLGGTVGQVQSGPMIVQALNQDGTPFAGATINWTTTAGSLSSSTCITDADGKASVTLTNPSTPQTTTVTATVGSLVVSFTQTAHMVLYGTFSPFPKLLRPAGNGDALAGVGFIPNDGLTYNLVAAASDEFNGASLDTTKWWMRYKDNNGTLDHYNNELQRYGNGHTVSNGTLKLVATPKSPAQSITANNQQFPLFDSQMIRSRTLLKYGYFEIRAKQPPGVGMWPAFWILPQVGAYPEIDIMDDAKNGTHEFWNMSHSNVSNVPTWNGLKRWLDKNKSWQYNYWQAPAPLSPTYFPDDFHVWSCLWEPDTVTTYIDGYPVTQWALSWVAANSNDPGGASVIANLAVGDAWATDNWTVQPVTTPQTYEIDYIRVYQRSDIAFTDVSPV